MQDKKSPEEIYISNYHSTIYRAWSIAKEATSKPNNIKTSDYDALIRFAEEFRLRPEPWTNEHGAAKRYLPYVLRQLGLQRLRHHISPDFPEICDYDASAPSEAVGDRVKWDDMCRDIRRKMRENGETKEESDMIDGAISPVLVLVYYEGSGGVSIQRD